MTGTAVIGERKQRIIDLDVTRAVALIGVALMNYHGFLINRGGEVGTSTINRFFDPFDGPLSTRFAATFVMVAGMGVTLLTAASRASGDRTARSDDRWRLIRRGVLLYGFGYVFNWIWSGTILFFYGAFFVAGALLFTLRSRWLVLIGAGAAAASAALRWYAFDRAADGHDMNWLFYPGSRSFQIQSPRRLLFDTFVNGTHPLLPWLAFLCAGMVLGRLLPLTAAWRVRLVLFGLSLLIVTYALRTLFDDTAWQRLVFSVDHWNGSLNYTVGTVGSSIVAFCVIGWIAERTRTSATTSALAMAGRMTLTLYVGHALVFNLLVNWWEIIRPTGLDTAVAFALSYWAVGIALAAWWTERFGMGPLERLYRRFGGDAPTRPGTCCTAAGPGSGSPS